MKHKILFVFLLFTSSIFSQKLLTENIIKTSDSILKLEVGEKLFKYFTISEGSYCKFQKKNNSKNYGKFLSEKVLQMLCACMTSW